MRYLDAFAGDVRYGLRMIRNSPGFTAVAVASLAVGIGASTILFSVANSLLFKPLQATEPRRLVQIFTSDSEGPLYGSSSFPDYEAFRDLPVFSGVLVSRGTEATLSGPDRPDVVAGVFVSGNYFDVLGLRPALGRFFVPEESTPPAAMAVVVLAHDTWRRRFGADPAVVGRSIELNGRPFTVIGVGPPRFTGTSIERAAEFFVPVTMYPVLSQSQHADPLRSRGHRAFTLLGRLAHGVTLPQASAALQATATALFELDREAWQDRSGRGRVVTVLPELEARFVDSGPGTLASIFLSVIGGSAALLLIACINVATVLLARASTRRKEIAIRLALGASRTRMIRQLLTECSLLAIGGGALGLWIAGTAAEVMMRFRPEGMPPFNLALDYRILLFSLAASVLTVVLFGLAPALQSTKPDVNAELKDTRPLLRAGRLRIGLRSGLVVTQVALSLALIVGATLLYRSVQTGLTLDPGFRRAGVVNVGINLSGVRNTDDAHRRFYREAVSAVASLPGVERVALAGLIPMDGSNIQVTIRTEKGGHPMSPDVNVVGPGYFALLDVPVKQGREFSASDHESSPLVAVVNETMARRLWNGEAIGRTFVLESTGDEAHVVGVVADLRHRSFGEPPLPMVYFSANQRPRPRMTLHLKTAVDAGAIGPTIDRTLQAIERSASLTPAESMDDYFARIMQPQRVGAATAAATGLLELALAVMALYGVIAFSVSQRRHEIGVRMALGASSRSVVGLVMRDGLLLMGIGLLVGVAVAFGSAVALQSLLIGIGPADPASFAAAILVLLLVGSLASYVPARRASSVDPGVALRSE